MVNGLVPANSIALRIPLHDVGVPVRVHDDHGRTLLLRDEHGHDHALVGLRVVDENVPRKAARAAGMCRVAFVSRYGSR